VGQLPASVGGRYRTTGGRSSRQREQSFGSDLREAEDFALKVEHDKRARVFVEPKAGRVLFRDAPELGPLTPAERRTVVATLLAYEKSAEEPAEPAGA
jgi:hypothetical protein